MAKTSILERHLAACADRPDECWPYPGYCNPRTGYGHTKLNGKRVGAHRGAYELLVGPVPGDLHLDHLCRNRPCCNPAHMEPVPPRVNILRGESPAARQAQQTECIHGHPLSGDNLYVDKRNRRHCVTCRNERLRALYYARTGGRTPPPFRADRDTHCPNGHEWTTENTYVPKGGGSRSCRVCRRASQARSLIRRREAA